MRREKSTFQDGRLSQNTECIVDRGARHKVSHGTIITQVLPHPRWLTHVDGHFLSSDADHTDISGSARARPRSGVRASIDASSTMLGRSLNGVARTRSSQGSKLRPQRRLHSNGRRTFLNSMPLPFASALSDCLRTWTATRPAGRSVSPSRSDGRGAGARENEGH